MIMRTARSALFAAAGLLAAFTTTANAETVVLRALDKTYGAAKDISVPVGRSVQFGTLTITAKSCAKRAPEETPEISAYLEINDKPLVDVDKPAAAEKPVFAGFMYWSSPALNALDHPSYDVWVIDCRA